jgi:hypothetical protein
MKALPLFATVLALGAGVLGAASAAQAQQPPGRQCFRLSEMHGWKPTPDARGLYYRVGLRDIYFAELAGACPMLKSPGVHLVNKVTNDMICSPIEFDLRVSDNIRGFAPVPCLVRSFRMLSPAEAAALPPKLRP